MGSDDVLVMTMALLPMGLAARLWWSSWHAVGELRASCAVGLGPPLSGQGHADAKRQAESVERGSGRPFNQP